MEEEKKCQVCECLGWTDIRDLERLIPTLEKLGIGGLSVAQVVRLHLLRRRPPRPEDPLDSDLIPIRDLLSKKED